MTLLWNDDLVFCTWSHRSTLPPSLRERLGDLDQLLRDLALSARSSVLLVAPYLSPAGMRSLKNSLGVAAQNGASIRLVTGDLDADGQRNRRAIHELISGDAGAIIARRLRVLTATETLPVLLHAKLVVVDGSHGYIGSANLSWHAMESNLEIGVSLSSPQASALEDLIAYFEGRLMLRELALPLV